ncbi:hypothetical protein ERJ75_001590400 [Trypanosoma vivax]|uniref:Axoneme central apparatus protein n=1 Tax=Trypanosoma vivax (strain Y486) TaxID=1055687 RepID=G0TSA6_TRYVY|nr:hypothetical protein TRVL_04397 [Trypanosoma vivax]KAH8605764.1 hypothetical protein ERJ75_001590400 [Trypanosoma vivax]CCC46832.1 conserved hypothetical protein [Trypanosoma vivax Y486]
MTTIENSHRCSTAEFNQNTCPSVRRLHNDHFRGYEHHAFSPNIYDVSRYVGSDYDDSSPEISSSEDSDVMPLHASQFRVKNNWRSSRTSAASYMHTEEELESDSYSECSLSFNPLHLTFVAGKRRVSRGYDSVEFSTSESENSDDDLNMSERTLAVEVLGTRRRSYQNFTEDTCYEIIETKAEEDEIDIVLPPLQAIRINQLIKRLRSDEAQVNSKDFEELDWDNPNFEVQLSALKKVAAYVEARELTVQTIDGSAINCPENTTEKVRVALLDIPMISQVEMKADSVKQVGAACFLRNCDGGPTSKRIAGASMDVRTMSHADAEGDFGTFSNITSDIKESYLSTRFAAIKSRREMPLKPRRPSQVQCKEAAFAEFPKAFRRRRSTNTHSQHQVFGIVDMDVADEILEDQEDPNTGVMGSRLSKSDLSGGITLSASSKRRKRKSNHVIESIPIDFELDETFIEDTTLGSKTDRHHAKKRRSRKKVERSINFSKLLDADDAKEIKETVEETAISETLDCFHDRTGREMHPSRHRSFKKGGSKHRSFFVEVPEECGEVAIDDCLQDEVLVTAKRYSTGAKGRKQRMGVNDTTDTKETDVRKTKDCVNSKTEPKDVTPCSRDKRKRRSHQKNKRNELEFSFIPEDRANEIVDPEDDFGLLHRFSNVTSLTHTKNDRAGQYEETRSTGGNSPLVLPRLASHRHSNTNNKPARRLSFSSNITKLPEIPLNEIQDTLTC